jgi:acetyl esterase/lipase
MDVFKHCDAPANAPIFLYVHGGGWVMGDRKNPPQPLVYQVASLGWVVCVIDYRLSPKVAFPTHLVDTKRAIAYLRRCARINFDADPEFIVVGGESAGGHLASLTALTAGDKSLQPGFEEVDTSVRGCVDTYGVHDFKDRHGVFRQRNKSNMFLRFIELLVMQKKLVDADAAFDQASPISWLDGELAATRVDPVPPFMVSHGSLDTLVPFDDSFLFYEQLQRYRERCAHGPIAGVHDIFIEVPGAHHAFNYMMSPRALAHGQAVCAFLDNLYRKTKRLDASASATAEAGRSAVEELEAHLSTSVVTEPTSRL